MIELGERGNSSLGFLFGAVFIIAGIIVAVITVMGFLNHLVPSEIASASYGYGIGAVIAIILLVIGCIILDQSK